MPLSKLFNEMAEKAKGTRLQGFTESIIAMANDKATIGLIKEKSVDSFKTIKDDIDEIVVHLSSYLLGPDRPTIMEMKMLHNG